MRGLLVALTISPALAFLSTPALADIITLDESDNGNRQPPSVPVHYQKEIPSDVGFGQLGLCEGPCPMHIVMSGIGFGEFSDVVTFLNGRATLLSDFANDDSPFLSGPPDNVGFPPHCTFMSSCKLIPETADANGTETLVYTPGPDDPGFSPSVPLTYVITSDPSGSDLAPVPEPSTLALAVPGMLPFALAYLKRRKQANKASVTLTPSTVYINT